jgi:hypothetical protein
MEGEGVGQEYSDITAYIMCPVLECRITAAKTCPWWATQEYHHQAQTKGGNVVHSLGLVCCVPCPPSSSCYELVALP